MHDSVDQPLTGEESPTDIVSGNSFTDTTPGSEERSPTENNSTNVGAENLAATSIVDKDNSTKDQNEGITVNNNSAMPSNLNDVITKIMEEELKSKFYHL